MYFKKLLLLSTMVLLPLFLFGENDTLKVRFDNRVEASKFKFRYNSKFNLKYLDVEGGLSSSFINAIAEDRSGNIWLATWGGGLMKFDGRNIYILNTHNGMPDNMVDFVYCDREGVIWIVVRNKVYYFDGRYFINISNQTGISDHSIIMMKQVGPGIIWALTQDSAIFQISKKTEVTRLDSVYHLHGVKRFYEVEQFEGKTYLTSSDGIFVFEGGKLKEKIMPGQSVFDLCIINKNDRVIHTDQYIHHIYFGDTTSILQEYDPTRIYEIQRDSLGNYWAVTFSHGIVKYNRKETVAFEYKNGLSNDIIWSSLIDSRGNVWLGTRAGGIGRYDNNLLRHYDVEDGLTSSTVWGITKDKKRDLIYLGILRGGVCVYKNGVITEAPFNEAFERRSVRSIYYDSHDNLWIGSSSGLFLYNEKGGLQDLRGRMPAFGKIVFRIKEDKNGHVWIMGDQGTACYDGKNFYRPFKTDSLNAVTCYDICWDSRGVTWLAHSNNVLALDKNEEPMFSDFCDSTKGGIVFNVIEDKNERMWIGSRRGFFVLDKDRIVRITEKEGLSNDIIWSSGFDQHGNLWAGTEFGLSKIHYEGPDDYNVEIFGMQEGFTGNDCTQNGLMIDEDGKFWWGTSKKLTIIDPEISYTKGSKPQVLITDILLHYKSLNLVDGYNQIADESRFNHLDHNDNYLTFSFVGIDWGSESKLRYQYKLEGFKEDWSPYDTKNSVTYSNLDPGKYILKIRAISNKGVVSDTKVLGFTINPAFWQTWWFRSMVVLMVALAIYMFIP